MKRTLRITGTRSGFGRAAARLRAGAGHAVHTAMREVDGAHAAVAHILRGSGIRGPRRCHRGHDGRHAQ